MHKRLLAGAVFGLLTTTAGAQLPDTLFATWSGDPCTSVELLWLERGVLSAAPEGTAPVEPWSARVGPASALPGGGVTVDGDVSEWGGLASRAFTVEFLANVDGTTYGPHEFDAEARFVWDADGLYVWVRVWDEMTTVSDDERLYGGDCVALFVNEGVGGANGYQVVASPEDDGVAARVQVIDERAGEVARAGAFASSSKRDDGYDVEFFVPASDFGKDAAAGTELGVQLHLLDRDTRNVSRGLVWYPGDLAWRDTTQRRRVVLSNEAGPRVTGRAEWAPAADVQLAIVEHAMVDTPAIRVSGRRDANAWLNRPGEEPIHLSADWSLKPAGRPDASWNDWRIQMLGDSIAIDDPLGLLLQSSVGVPAISVDAPASIAVHPAVRFGPTGWFVRRVSLTGLPAGKDVTVTLDGEAFVVRTAPRRLTEPMTFANGGDVGTTPQHVLPLHDQAAAADPLFGLVGGDLAYANAVDVERWVVYLRQWHGHMQAPTEVGAPRLIPMIVTLGNHEVPGGFNASRGRSPFFFALFGQAGSLYAERSYATLDFGRYLSLVLLDSQHVSPVAGEQTVWLGDVLAERARVPHLFTAYHVPAYPAHRDFNSTRGDRPGIREHWVPLFEEFGVDVSFEHDDHVFKRTHALMGGEPAEGGVVYLGDGAWGMGDRAAMSPSHLPNGVAYLAASASERHVHLVTIAPGGGQAFVTWTVDGTLLDAWSWGGRGTAVVVEEERE